MERAWGSAGASLDGMYAALNGTGFLRFYEFWTGAGPVVDAANIANAIIGRGVLVEAGSERGGEGSGGEGRGGEGGSGCPGRCAPSCLPRMPAAACALVAFPEISLPHPSVLSPRIPTR